MLGTDDSRPNLTDEMSNTSSPYGDDSPTCFIRQSTLKTKEQFTQYPCLGKINSEYFNHNNYFILHAYIYRSIS